MIRTIGVVLIVFACGRLHGQGVSGRQSVYLSGKGLQVVMTPDVEGLYLWASSGDAANNKERSYGALFDPAQALTWVASARAFLDTPLGEKDTGSVRISPVLWGSEGGRAYLGKRRDRKGWSDQRVFVIQSDSARVQPVVAAIDEKLMRQVLDSLEFVSGHAPAPQHPAAHDSAGEGLLFDHIASLRPGTEPPSYPESERSERKEGLVLVRFIIGADGRVDLPTITFLHASSPGFLESTLIALTRFRFSPATLRGKPVRQQVVMPFVFANR
jgi:TonB family protein